VRVSVTSLGCPKNLVDSEVMMGILSSKGYELVQDPAEAELIICNTCAFVQDAAQESVNQVLELASYKKTGNLRVLVVAGCLGQRYGEGLLRAMPEVDGVIGTGEFPKIADICERTLSGERVVAVAEPECLYDHLTPRLLLTPTHYAYLKIAEGCDNLCSYCVIPGLRGKYRSREFGSVVAEAEILADRGVKEIVLVAQDTTNYGRDLYGKPRLAELLQAISRIEGIRWLRLLYTHPRNYTDELVKTVSEEDRILKYLDLPVQHISDRMLKAMNRNVTGAEIEGLISKLRRRIPGLALRTSLIVGFPGEGEEEFEELLDFVGRVKFERLGVFRYSREEGTALARMRPQVPEGVKAEREETILELQRRVSGERNACRVGEVLEVLVDAKVAPGVGPFGYLGRTAWDAPEIDCSVFLRGKSLKAGEFVKARIFATDDFDLFGEVVSAPFSNL